MGNTKTATPTTVKAVMSSKVVEGERTITAVVSSSNFDRDYERVDVPSLRLPLKGGGHVRAKDLTGNEAIDIPMLLNHSFDVEDVIGSVRKAYLNDSGELVAEFGVSGRAKAQDLMILVDEGHLDNAFSITMNDYEYMDSTIIDAEVIEISLVFRGANQDARLLAVKSLIKESNMAASQTLDDKKALLKQLETEVAEAESKTEEVKEDEVVEEEPKPIEIEESTEVKEESESEEETEKPVETKSIKQEDTKMTEQESKEITNKSVTPKNVEEAPTQVESAKKTMSEKEMKVLVAKQIRALFVDKDHAEVARLNKIAMENDTADAATKAFKSKFVGYDGASSESLYLAEQLDRDVDAQYGDFGNVGALVRRITLTESPKYRRVVRSEGVVFMKPGFEGTKGEDTPVWTSFSLEPKPFAVIVGWNDHTAEDAYIAMYEEIVRDIAEAQARLEDTIILTEAGSTAADGTVYPVQGLVPILEAASGREVAYDYTSNILTQFATGYGLINSAARNNLSLVINGTDWAKLALIRDGEGRLLWTGTGDSVALGALGTVRVVTSDLMPAGQFILGNFQNYVLAEKEGLALFESRHATVGSVNAFTDDATFLRAVKRLEGGTARTNAFVLFTEATS